MEVEVNENTQDSRFKIQLWDVGEELGGGVICYTSNPAVGYSSNPVGHKRTMKTHLIVLLGGVTFDNVCLLPPYLLCDVSMSGNHAVCRDKTVSLQSNRSTIKCNGESGVN